MSRQIYIEFSNSTPVRIKKVKAATISVAAVSSMSQMFYTLRRYDFC